MFIDYKLEKLHVSPLYWPSSGFVQDNLGSHPYHTIKSWCRDFSINTTCTRTIYRMILGYLGENLTMVNKVPKHVVF